MRTSLSKTNIWLNNTLASSIVSQLLQFVSITSVIKSRIQTWPEVVDFTDAVTEALSFLDGEEGQVVFHRAGIEASLMHIFAPLCEYSSFKSFFFDD